MANLSPPLGYRCQSLHWKHFWLSQLGEVTSGQWVEPRNSAKHPTIHRIVPTTKNYLSKMFKVLRLRNTELKTNCSEWRFRCLSFIPTGTFHSPPSSGAKGYACFSPRMTPTLSVSSLPALRTVHGCGVWVVSSCSVYDLISYLRTGWFGGSRERHFS